MRHRRHYRQIYPALQHLIELIGKSVGPGERRRSTPVRSREYARQVRVRQHAQNFGVVLRIDDAAAGPPRSSSSN
jgi:hypothetical protein